MVANPKTASEENRKSSQLTDIKSDVPLTDILSLAENSIENLKNILESFDAKIYAEFREIAEQINFTKNRNRPVKC